MNPPSSWYSSEDFDVADDAARRSGKLAPPTNSPAVASYPLFQADLSFGPGPAGRFTWYRRPQAFRGISVGEPLVDTSAVCGPARVTHCAAKWSAASVHIVTLSPQLVPR
jgi:hypothetical protein